MLLHDVGLYTQAEVNKQSKSEISSKGQNQARLFHLNPIRCQVTRAGLGPKNCSGIFGHGGKL